MSEFYMPKVDLDDIVADIKRRMANNQTVTEDELRRITGSNEAQVIFPLEMFARLIEQNAALKEECVNAKNYMVELSKTCTGISYEMYSALKEENERLKASESISEALLKQQNDRLKARVSELEAAKSEPVLYQYRMRPTWDKEAKFQDDWILCSQAKYAQYQAQQVYGDWEYQSRALYSSDPDLDALKARVAEQSAYILRLRKAIIDATNSGAQLDSGTWVYSIDDSVLEWPDALKEPANEG